MSLRIMLVTETLERKRKSFEREFTHKGNCYYLLSFMLNQTLSCFRRTQTEGLILFCWYFSMELQ